MGQDTRPPGARKLRKQPPTVCCFEQKPALRSDSAGIESISALRRHSERVGLEWALVVSEERRIFLVCTAHPLTDENGTLPQQ
jgi:hypothetical protein